MKEEESRNREGEYIWKEEESRNREEEYIWKGKRGSEWSREERIEKETEKVYRETKAGILRKEQEERKKV